MPLKILYENDTLLVIDKPAGFAVWNEEKSEEQTIGDLLLKQNPKQKSLGRERRYGIVHRLDKETSGVLIAAKDAGTFAYLQGQFRLRNVEKKYLCLVEGNIKEDEGKIETLLGRSPNDRRKQKVFLLETESQGKRIAVTEFRVMQRYERYTLLQVAPKTGRKHQIRAHFAYLNHPLAGDKLYGFKNQKIPNGLARHFLHAEYLKLPILVGTSKEFHSPLPEDLQNVLNQLQPI